MDGRKDSDEEETGERRGLAGRLGPSLVPRPHAPPGEKRSGEETGERRGLAGRLGPRVDGRKDSDEEENGERDEGKVRLLMCTLNLYLQRLRSRVM